MHHCISRRAWTIFQQLGQQDELGQAHGYLAYVDLAQDNWQGAQTHIVQALQQASVTRTILPILMALSVAARLFVVQEEPEMAVETVGAGHGLSHDRQLVHDGRAFRTSCPGRIRLASNGCCRCRRRTRPPAGSPCDCGRASDCPCGFCWTFYPVNQTRNVLRFNHGPQPDLRPLVEQYPLCYQSSEALIENVRL